MENVLHLDIEEIITKIQKQKDQLKYNNKAILHAAQLNAHDFGGDRASNLLPDAGKFSKMKDWLMKARKNETNNLHLQHQLKKLHFLSQNEVTLKILRGDKSEKELAQTMAARARFSVPIETELAKLKIRKFGDHLE